MATTKFFLDTRGKAQDGKGSVLIRIYKNGTSTTVSTGIRVSENCWSNDCVVHVPNAEIINANLVEKKTQIDKAIALLSMQEGFADMTATDLKVSIFSSKRVPGSHYVKDLFEEYIETGNLKEGTKEIYRTALKKVIDFGGNALKIESINLKWLRSFDQHLASTQRTNGKAIYLRCLRAVYNYARHIDIVTQYPFYNFRIKQEETAKRSISISAFRKLYKTETDEKTKIYKDYFFLIFFLIGINVKDLLLAEKSQIIGERLEYTREKTNKRYSIKIEPEANELMQRYAGKDNYIMNAMDHCQHYKSFAREINSAMKELCKNKSGRLDISDITTYYARHTWATLAHEIGISTDVISMALGHSPINRTTAIYIKPDRNKIDEANRKVIDYFLKGI